MLDAFPVDRLIKQRWYCSVLIPFPKGRVTSVVTRVRGNSLLSVVGKPYGRVLIYKELGLELNVQLGRSNVGLGMVDGAWIKCLL